MLVDEAHFLEDYKKMMKNLPKYFKIKLDAIKNVNLNRLNLKKIP